MGRSASRATLFERRIEQERVRLAQAYLRSCPATRVPRIQRDKLSLNSILAKMRERKRRWSYGNSPPLPGVLFDGLACPR